jgi:hypothetical protein
LVTNNQFGITKGMVIEILKGISLKLQKFREFKDEYSMHFSNKNLSEIVGKMLEKDAADIFTKHLGYRVIKCEKDHDPDLIFTGINNKPLEIKITSTDITWTGGEFSTRPFDYLLISWDPSNFNHFFCCLVHLEKSDWVSNIAKKFYVPSLDIKKLYERQDKIIFLGSLEKTPRGAIKIRRHDINQKAFS